MWKVSRLNKENQFTVDDLKKVKVAWSTLAKQPFEYMRPECRYARAWWAEMLGILRYYTLRGWMGLRSNHPHYYGH